MDKEQIILSDLDIKILNYLKEEHIITEIVSKFNFSFSQCKRHIKRIEIFLTKRNYGNFRFLKLNNKGFELIKILK